MDQELQNTDWAYAAGFVDGEGLEVPFIGFNGN